MNTRFTRILWVISLVPLLQINGLAAAKGPKQTDPSQVPALLSSMALPELPAGAAKLVQNAKQKDQETVALAAIQWTATAHPGSLAEVVGSLVGVLPGNAPDLALTAAKLVPADAAAIDSAAIHGAPGEKNQINQALASFLSPTPGNVANPNSSSGRGSNNSGSGNQGNGDDGNGKNGNGNGSGNGNSNGGNGNGNGSNANGNANGQGNGNGNGGSKGNGHDNDDHDGTIGGDHPNKKPHGEREPDHDRDDHHRRQYGRP